VAEMHRALDFDRVDKERPGRAMIRHGGVERMEWPDVRCGGKSNRETDDSSGFRSLAIAMARRADGCSGSLDSGSLCL